MKHRILGALLMLLAWHPSLDAQVSLVPAQHPVYDWLYRQRVLGNLDRFQYEAQPLSRGQITAALHEVEAHQDRLGAADESLLHAYLQEFSLDGLRESAGENWFKGEGHFWDRIVRMFRNQKEPHLFAYADSGYSYALDGFYSQGAVSVNEGGESYSSQLVEKGVRAYASFYGHLGFHAEVGNLWAGGDKRVLALDDQYNKTWDIVGLNRGNSNYYETVASGRLKAISAHIGHASLRYGGGPGQPLALSTEAPTFDWIRLNIDTRLFHYTALHGALAGPREEGIIIAGPDTVRTRYAKDRWLSMHRIDFTPSGSFGLGFSEILVYSGRGVDLAYVNPVTPLFYAESNNENRDNVFWAFDLRWRPARGAELFGTLFVDDASGLFQLLGPEKAGAKNPDRAFEIGATGSLASGLDVGARYTRVDPWVYTHWMALNTYEQRGFSLGSQLGPNTDQWQFSIRQWLPGRGWIEARAGGTRYGLNPVDSTGAVTENVGGDLMMGQRTPETEELLFLEDADVQKSRDVTVEGAWEPWRGIQLHARYVRRSMTQGTRIPNRSFFDVRLKIGF